VAILVALWSASPRSPQAGPAIRLADVAAAVSHWYLPESRRALESGDLERAARVLVESLRLEPAFIEDLLQRRREVERADRDYLLAFAELHGEAARAMQRAGHEAEAARLRQREEALERIARTVARDRSG
jgi:hypothetical protein